MRTPRSRHPAVVDLLDPAEPERSRQDTYSSRSSNAARPTTGRPARRIAMTGVAAGVAVAAVVGGIATFGGDSDNSVDSERTSSVTTSDTGLPALNLPVAPTTPNDAARSPADDGCAADRGDQKSGAGVIRAFQYAYYVRRDGAAARALAAPSTTVVDGPALQTFIDALPQGTSYCLTVSEIDSELYVTRLTEMRPGQPPQPITQTISTKEIDGTWFVEAFQG